MSSKRQGPRSPSVTQREDADERRVEQRLDDAREARRRI